MAGPVDIRLVRYASGVRRELVAYVAVSAITAVLVIAQAFSLGEIIPRVFLDGADLSQVSTQVTVLGLVILGRVLVAGLADFIATRAAVTTSSELRKALLARVTRLGPLWLTNERRVQVATLATRGVETIEPYVSRYLPALIIAIVVPLTVGFAILTQDLLAAVIVAVTAPLIPVFMILIGKYTESATAKQWGTLKVLAGHFLDVVAGLPTLKAFGREDAQQERMAQIDQRYRTTTLGVLRVSFLSSFVLELLATLSVAVVAVSIGLRLISGHLDLRTGLTVLILAPEVYLPIRMVGTHFHAAADGMQAAQEIFTILDLDPATHGSRTDIPRGALVITNLSAGYPGSDSPALQGVSFIAEPGTVTAVTGSSGVGKSTLLSVLAGFLEPSSGLVEIAGVDLREFEPSRWRASLSVVEQDPVLLGPTVGDDVRRARPQTSPTEIAQVLRMVGLTDRELPRGEMTPVGDLGSDVSAGQRRRIALARVALSPAPFILLDEPTAGLDDEAEHTAMELIRGFAVAGSVVIVIAHRPALIDAADQIVELQSERAAL